MTLAQDLRNMITELDRANANDDVFRQAFSSFAREPPRQGQTWRQRLVRWCEREEALAQAQTSADYAVDHPPYRGQWFDT
jgi:hypothetical protein